MVNHEILSDCRAGMDIHACLAVRMLRENARNHRNMELVEFMRAAVDRDGIHARVAEDNLALGIRGRVAVQNRLKVRVQIFPDLWDPADELDSNLLRLSPQLLSGARGKLIGIPERNLNLFLKIDDNIIDNSRYLCLHVVDTALVVGIPVVPRINDLKELMQNPNDHIPVRRLCAADLIDGTSALIIIQDGPHNLRSLILHAEPDCFCCILHNVLHARPAAAVLLMRQSAAAVMPFPVSFPAPVLSPV